MKESVTIQYRCEDADTNLVETIPIASIGIDQWSQGHPVLFNLDRRGTSPAAYAQRTHHRLRSGAA